MVDIVTNNIYFEALQVVYDILNQNIADPNSIRASKDTAREKQWIFPTYPEANDEWYPRLAIIHGQMRFEEWTPFRFYDWVTDDLGNITGEAFSNFVILPIRIGAFTKKTRHKSLEVQDWNQEKRFVENSAQVAWLLDRIQKTLLMHRDKFIEKGMDFDILTVEGIYEDLDFLWAGSVNIEVIMNNTWTNSFTDSGTGIITNIGGSNLNIDVDKFVDPGCQ